MLRLELRQTEGRSGSFTASRLLEIFCAEAFRAYQRDMGPSSVGWFRDTIGQTAMEYVTRCRMALACRLLDQEDESIEAVAVKAGYSGVPSFARVFKKLIGATPAQWRAHRVLQS